MGPPVVVVPGQYAPSPPSMELEVQLPVCPPGVPCVPVCPPLGPCPPAPCACPTNGVMAPEPVLYASQPVHYAPPQPAPAVQVAPTQPAPGTLQLAYTGAFDGSNVLHGGALRFTGHIEDVWFIEAEIGGKGARASALDIGEFQFVLGPRVMAPIIPSVLRLYGVLATGIVLRSIGNGVGWGIWPLQLGGGLEVGAPLTDNWSIGGFIDVRGELRVPFERDAASFGFTWSAGLAIMWF